MVQRGIKGVRASWADAQALLAREQEIADPPPEEERDFGNGLLIGPGQWPGAPADRLPPKCPVIPLGVDGKTTYFVDTLGQLIAVGSSEWSKKMLVQLFALQPNFLYWAWPRWAAPKPKKASFINGLEVDDAVQALLKAAAKRGLFTPLDRVRGRGAWVTRSNDLMWHAGDALYRIEGTGKHTRLTAARPGEVDGIFYPQRPPVTPPWQEPVDPTDSPVHDILKSLRSWTWERPDIDPLLVLGAIGCLFLGAALPWRPHLFAVGDKGVGKSTLQFLVKGILGDALHSSADTTAAGIYQRVGVDSLPVAIDELEASADNRRVMAVVALARLASSGALMFRGGAEHTGVEFRLTNSFFFSAINPPPLDAQDRSRMAIVNLGKFVEKKQRQAPSIDGDATGRMILRALMDAWPRFEANLRNWKQTLFAGGLDSRAQDTYGTLLCVAHLLLGDEAMEEAGLPVTEEQRLGDMVGLATAQDRAEAQDNWRACLEYLLGSVIEAWKGGEKPTIGGVIERWEEGIDALEADHSGAVNHKLALVGLKGREEFLDERTCAAKRRLLCVPVNGKPLEQVFANSKWRSGVWASALKQAPAEIVIRDRGNGQNVKINRVTVRCLLVDLAAYDAHVTPAADVSSGGHYKDGERD